jgi:hypothetical protein
VVRIGGQTLLDDIFVCDMGCARGLDYDHGKVIGQHLIHGTAAVKNRTSSLGAAFADDVVTAILDAQQHLRAADCAS